MAGWQRQRAPSDLDPGWREQVVEVGPQQIAEFIAAADAQPSEHPVQVALHRPHRQVKLLAWTVWPCTLLSLVVALLPCEQGARRSRRLASGPLDAYYGRFERCASSTER